MTRVALILAPALTGTARALTPGQSSSAVVVEFDPLSASAAAPGSLAGAARGSTVSLLPSEADLPIAMAFAFLTDIVASQPSGKEFRVIADNFSAHKSKQVEQFLTEHPSVHRHFTPTYSPWLDQVELWFAKIERDVIARGVFTSVPDLTRRLMRYIRHYNKQPKPVKWKYFDPSRRITSTSSVTVR
jgi:transposase